MSDATLHPRNRHPGRYDFEKLIKGSPGLRAFVVTSPRGDLTVDFADPAAVLALNAALLKDYYGISRWELPEGYLCPPIPGRSDHIHHLADLLASVNGDEVPRGDSVRVLDIGVGASCIYPIVGHREYGWKFLGSEVDPVALASARKIVDTNPELKGAVELRMQKAPAILKGLFKEGEEFDLALCNPPFHASLEEARAGSRRKWRNLGRAPESKQAKPVQNFGGQGSELWVPGGEEAFVGRLIEESAEAPKRVLWYSSLVAKGYHLDAIEAALERVGAADSFQIEMELGQKRTRIVAWTFLSSGDQAAWRERRWHKTSTP